MLKGFVASIISSAQSGTCTNKDDRLPKKFYRALQGEGPSAGVELSHAEVENAIDEYYKMAGWTDNGEPTPESLGVLGLDWAVDLL